MAKRNLTLQLDEDVIRRAKVLAAKRGTSVSGLVARELEHLVAQDARYVEAWYRAGEIVALYSQWPTVQVDVALILAASKLEERHTLSFWDALIVEAARRAGATRLLTEDLQAGRQVGGVKINNPFA